MALLDVDAGGTITPRYVEFIEGRKQEAKGNAGTSFTLTLDTAAAAKRPGSLRDRRAALGPACQGLTAGQIYGVQAVVRAQYPANAVRLYVDRNQDGDFADAGELVLTNFMIFGTWGGGHVGLYPLTRRSPQRGRAREASRGLRPPAVCPGYRATSTTTTTLQWDNFLCGYDVDNDEVIGSVTNPDPGDYLYARYTFDDPGGGATWQTIAYTHDANGNLTGDGLYKYTYDAWNP